MKKVQRKKKTRPMSAAICPAFVSRKDDELALCRHHAEAAHDELARQNDGDAHPRRDAHGGLGRDRPVEEEEGRGKDSGLCEEQDERRRNEHLIRNGIEKFAEIGDKVPRARDVAVEGVGERRQHKDDGGDQIVIGDDGKIKDDDKERDHEDARQRDLVG